MSSSIGENKKNQNLAFGRLLTKLLSWLRGDNFIMSEEMNGSDGVGAPLLRSVCSTIGIGFMWLISSICFHLSLSHTQQLKRKGGDADFWAAKPGIRWWSVIRKIRVSWSSSLWWLDWANLTKKFIKGFV